MLIYAEDNQIVLECEHCQVVERIDKPMQLKRVFQSRINKFKRKHDWLCQIEADRTARRKAAIDETESIIRRLSASCR